MKVHSDHDLHISFGTQAAASPKHPSRNEDASFVLKKERAAGIFDGLGGHADGDVASHMAARIVAREIKKNSRVNREMTSEEARTSLRKFLKEADEAIHRKNQEREESRAPRESLMYTTASVVMLRENIRGQLRAVIGNVGDSRVYILRKQRLAQVTLDDGPILQSVKNLAAVRALQSKLSNVINPFSELNQAELAIFLERHRIFSALGKGRASPRMQIAPLNRGERILLCSDGLSDNRTDREMEAILLKEPDPKKAANKLVRAARENFKLYGLLQRAKPDDVTVCVIDIG